MKPLSQSELLSEQKIRHTVPDSTKKHKFSLISGENLNDRIFVAISLIAFISCFAGLSINIVIGLPSTINIYVFLLASSFAVLYYLARFKKHYYKHLLVLIGTIGLSMTWISEGGFSGPILPLFVVAIVVFTAISDAKHHIYYVIFLLINIVSLFALEHSSFSKHIGQYPDKLSHDIDVFTTLIISIIGIYLFVQFIRRVYIKNYIKTIAQKQELEQFNHTKDRFFSIIAHDLRGPFNGMIELTQLMSDESTGLSKEELQDLSGKLSHSAKNTYNLLENLLSWAKMNQGMIPYAPTIIPLRKFTSVHLESMQDLANRKGINTANYIPDNTLVFADENMLQTIIRNFIMNAIKFTKKGGMVSIDAKALSNTMVEISIADNGIGMDKKAIENLFSIDKKTQRAGTQSEPSSGLGLLLCKEFIEKHQGSIKIESKVNHGSIFRFTLPISASKHE